MLAAGHSEEAICPGCGMHLPNLRRHMKRCCPERLPERLRPAEASKMVARQNACGEDGMISDEEVKAAALRALEAVEDPLLRQVLVLRFGLDQGGNRRTPAEVAEALDGKHRGNAQVALTLIRNALRSIPLVADDPQDLEILYEDDELLAVVKPAFLRSTPVHRFIGRSLTNQIVGYMLQQQAHAGGSVEPPLMLHRLDQTTSGVVLCAKTKGAARFLHDRWHGPECRKEYLALARRTAGAKLRGDVGESLVVCAPIGRDKASLDPVRRAVDHEEGRKAATRLEVLAAGAVGAPLLLACTLEESGRTHQIRIHAAHVGLPILGDIMYGGQIAADDDMAPGRVVLHAWRLHVLHPCTGEPLLLEAPLPEDMQQCLHAHGLGWPQEGCRDAG